MTMSSRIGGKDLRARLTDPVDEALTDEGVVALDHVDATARLRGGSRGGAPGRGEGGPVEGPGAALDNTSDNPLDFVAPVGPDDDSGARVLLVDGVETVHRVGPGDAVVAVSADGEVARQSGDVEEGQKGDGDGNPPDSSHVDQPRELLDQGDVDLFDDRLVLPRWLKISGVLFALFIGAALAFAIFEPIQVLPRIRLAPGYALTSDDGSLVTSEDARGEITLYTFSRTDCGEACADIDQIMAEVRDGVAAQVDLGEVDFGLVTIALDPIAEDGSALSLAAAAEAAGADGDEWRWVGGSERDLQNVVGAGFQRSYQSTSATTFDPGFVLVDGLGVVRGDYRYETLGDTADKLIRHVGVLGDELRYRNGTTAIAYEAAHLFLCYP